MKIGFSIHGLVIFMLPMLINIIYALFPPTNVAEEASDANKILTGVENGSRVLFAIAICILVSKRKVDYQSLWLYLGLVFLVLYYIVWIRYFIGGRDVALWGKSFLFVPIPLAVFPVLYFLFASIWLHNYVAVILMVIFGIAHNVSSYISFREYM